MSQGRRFLATWRILQVLAETKLIFFGFVAISDEVAVLKATRFADVTGLGGVAVDKLVRRAGFLVVRVRAELERPPGETAGIDWLFACEDGRLLTLLCRSSLP
jgi:hypothetical protein